MKPSPPVISTRLPAVGIPLRRRHGRYRRRRRGDPSPAVSAAPDADCSRDPELLRRRATASSSGRRRPSRTSSIRDDEPLGAGVPPTAGRSGRRTAARARPAGRSRRPAPPRARASRARRASPSAEPGSSTATTRRGCTSTSIRSGRSNQRTCSWTRSMLERPAARGRRDERQRHDLAPRRPRGRPATAGAAPSTTRSPDAPARAEADRAAPRPRLAAAVLDQHVDLLLDARAERRQLVDERQPRLVRRSRRTRPAQCRSISSRVRALEPRRAVRRTAAVRPAPPRQRQILRGHLARRRIDAAPAGRTPRSAADRRRACRGASRS